MYSKEFKEKVKKVFPNDEELHRKLNEENDEQQLTCFLNHYFLFKELCQIGSIRFETILAAQSLTMLQDEAKKGMEKREIYLEWCKICRNNGIYI